MHSHFSQVLPTLDWTGLLSRTIGPGHWMLYRLNSFCFWFLLVISSYGFRAVGQAAYRQSSFGRTLMYRIIPSKPVRLFRKQTA